jgi:predicted membrane-bound spermidine synthase
MTYIRRTALEIAVFLCGAVVMIYEIIGSRLVSPYIGGSIYIWTSLIGVILGSLSLGYWLGGRLADKKPDIRHLASIIFAAAALIAITTLVKDVFLAAIASAAMILEIKAVIASLVLFAPASIFLGMVTPYAIKLKMLSLYESGRTVGNLYALSTIGSIVGTFSAGFLLVPFVGSVRTLYIIAAILFVVAIMLFPLRFTVANIAALMIFVAGIAASEFTRYYLYEQNELVDIDTEYSRIQVFRTTDPVTSRPIRAYATDPYFAQSAVFYDSDDLVFPYARFYDLLKHFNPGFQRTLMLGGGGFTYPRHYVETYPNATIDVVEIDPKVERIARKYFRLRDDPRLKVFHEDGRVFLNKASAGTYDAILIDAFGSLFSVPFQLTTREAVQRMYDALNDRGVVIANIGSSITGSASHFLQAELTTYRSVFPQVLIFKVKPERADTDLQNLILVALKRDETLDLSSDDPELDILLSHLYTESIETNRATLTDDLAPVEHYSSRAQHEFLSRRY